MVATLMSRQALRHPYAMTKKAYTLEDVLQSKAVGKVTNLLECARRADGGAAIILASPRSAAIPSLHSLNHKLRRCIIL
jgi:acetyl-CoA acetyltransferase